MNIVKAFYDLLPFNKADHREYIKQINKKETPWPALTSAIENADSVLELGSGQGWLSNRIALQYPNTHVTGIDIVQENIRRSNEYAPINATFVKEDILHTERHADVVISVGVLHHIPEHHIQKLMMRAIDMADEYAFIGLYHKHSREYMLNYFANIYPESKRYRQFKKMTPWINSEEHRESWYRDQLLHPYECMVTVEDYYKVAEETNTELVWLSTDSDETLATDAMNKISSYEFTSGFIYGLFKKE